MADSVTASRQLRETCELPVEWADPADAMRKSSAPAAVESNIGTAALKTGQRVNVAGGAGVVGLHPR